MKRNTQPDLFDLLAPASPPVPSSDGGVEGHARQCGSADAVNAQEAGVEPGPSEIIHWLAIGTERARTGCGIIASEYLRSERAAIAAEGGERFSCTLDRFSDAVTCEHCLEMVR